MVFKLAGNVLNRTLIIQTHPHKPALMTFKPPLLFITRLAVFVAASLSCVAAQAAPQGESFAVTGERVVTAIPQGWKLAWMMGTPAGGFMAEYIPAEDNIDTWHGGYLAIARFPYPSAKVMQEFKDKKVHPAEVAQAQLQDALRNSCGDKFEAMPRGLNQLGDLLFSVSGGYCPHMGTTAPFGEGSFVAFIEGKEFLHKVQYSWRPASTKEQDQNKPWGIGKDKSVQYLEAMKASTLCDGSYKACSANYR